MAPVLDQRMSRLTAVAAIFLLGTAAFSGCASSTTPAPPLPVARPADPTHSVAIIASGQSQFAVDEFGAEPGRTLDEVLKYPYWGLLRPLAGVVHHVVNRYLHTDRGRTIEPTLPLPPSSIVGEAMARSLQASGRFTEVRVVEREPTGADGQQADMIVRVTVPTWGLMRVRAGEPDLVSGFVDTRATMSARGTGVVVWETEEDVTAPRRLPLESLTRDQQIARQELIGVLERAGQRLASELLYARSDAL